MAEQDVPAAEPTNPKTPAQALADEYDIGDGEATASAPSPEVPSGSPAVQAPRTEPSLLPERGPDGRFLSAAETTGTIPAAHQHSPSIVRRAKRHGLTEAELADYTPEILEGILDDREAQIVAYQRQKDVIQSMNPPAPAAADPASPPSPQGSVSPAPAGDQVDWGTDENGQPLSEDAFHPAIVKLFKQCLREIKALKEQTGHLTQREVARENETRSETCDRVFAEREDLFGKGNRRTLAKDDPGLQRRLAVLAIAEKTPGRTVEECLTKAIQVLYGTTTPTAPAEPVTDDKRATEWANATVARPTQRKPGVEPLGDKKAEKAVAERLREYQAAAKNGEAGDASLDDFPD